MLSNLSTWLLLKKTKSTRHNVGCILNGAYGMLRPLDKYRPVRLEMGHNWCPLEGCNTMSQFWRPKLKSQLLRESAELGTPKILNLASAEYGDVALNGRPTQQVVSCVFL